MLLSMTGHGEAHRQENDLAVAIELRAINNRYCKINVRCSDGYGSLDSQIESAVRRHIRRGTIQVNLRVDRKLTEEDFKLNEAVLAGYRRQLEGIYDSLHAPDSIHLEALLSLPGVIDERLGLNVDTQADWPTIEAALNEALEGLATMRADEGHAMAKDLQINCGQVADELTAIAERAPLVVEAYRTRLTERLNKILTEYDARVEPADVVREVGIFAERSDISEEIVRLRSHLEQFDEIMNLKESSGRKLEFLIQEMYREVNTIGSKANDAQIARHVIEIKASIERMREMIQNVE